MDVFTTPFLTGSATGAILLMAALGLTLTFGQMGVINMANGEFLMVGAYSAYVTQQVITSPGLSIVIALPVAFVVSGLLGLLLEVSVIQWMYKRPLDTLLVTVGVSLVLQQLARDIQDRRGDSGLKSIGRGRRPKACIEYALERSTKLDLLDLRATQLLPNLDRSGEYSASLLGVDIALHDVHDALECPIGEAGVLGWYVLWMADTAWRTDADSSRFECGQTSGAAGHRLASFLAG